MVHRLVGPSLNFVVFYITVLTDNIIIGEATCDSINVNVITDRTAINLLTDIIAISVFTDSVSVSVATCQH